MLTEFVVAILPIPADVLGLKREERSAIGMISRRTVGWSLAVLSWGRD